MRREEGGQGCAPAGADCSGERAAAGLAGTEDFFCVAGALLVLLRSVLGSRV